MSSTELLERADGLRKAKDHAGAIAAYMEALTDTEIAPGGICLSLARSHMALGQIEEATNWLLRIAQNGEDFRNWQAAASLLDKLLKDGDPAPARIKRRAKLWLTGSYTLSQLAPLLRLAALEAGVALDIKEGDYGQYRQDAIDPASALYAFDPDIIIMALHHGETGLPAISDTPEESVTAAASGITSLWKAIRSRSKARLIVTNIAASPEEAFGHLSARLPGPNRALINALNIELGKAANDMGGVSILDAEALSSLIGKRNWFDDRYWHISKQAVSFEALPLLARHFAALIAAELGLSKKCLVLDLDNTLWGGVIGEDGLAGIKIGQGDPASEAHLAFQHYIKGLQAKGVILAVCSKNNDADAREPFLKHPEMVLKLDDIAMFVANWERKSDNLAHIARALNIGMDALVFVDDNPVEREIVRQFAPDVDVVTLPADASGYVRALSDYLKFETVSFTEEDAKKTAQYRAKAEIAELETSVGSMEEFYASLQMKAVLAPFDDLHMPRIVQLIGKTNQFNLTTQRYSEGEVRTFMSEDGAGCFYLKLQDRFADHGLVSMIMARKDKTTLDIHLWLMSCRVIGRTVEAELLAQLCELAQKQGLTQLRGTYIPSTKNGMVAGIYEKFGFDKIDETEDGQTIWVYDLETKGLISNTHIERLALETGVSQ